MNKDVSRRRNHGVVAAEKGPANEIPIVKPVRSGHRDHRRTAFEAAFDPFQPLKWRPAVSIQVGEEVARRGATAGLACHDQAFRWLVDDANTRDRGRHSTRVVGAGVVDDDDFVWRSTLTKKRM